MSKYNNTIHWMAHLDIATSATAFLLDSPGLCQNIDIMDDMHIYGTTMFLLRNQTIAD
jgi:hypothetical protein